jgi:TadE-like protein
MTVAPAVLPPVRPSATAPGSSQPQGPRSPSVRPGPEESRGAVTAEFAVTLPAVLLLLAMLLSGASAGVTQLRLEEGARAGARALARGDDSATVERIVHTLTGGSASAAVSADGEWLNVTVSGRVGGPLGASIPWLLTARASTRTETAG